MAGSTKTNRFRFWIWLIQFIGLIVPRRLRANWRREWEAELRAREELLAEWDRLDCRSKLDLLWRSASAFWDALWLQPKRLEDEMFQDLRYGARMLVRQPGFTFVSALTLALGIGANTAIFSVVNAILLRPLPYQNPDRLVFVWGRHAGQPDELQQISYPDFNDIRQQNRVFDEISAMFIQAWTLTGQGEADRVVGLMVSSNIFRLLGVQPMLGRAFTPEEEQPGKERVAVFSHRLWQKRFGADPEVIGRAVTLNGESYTLIGVLPPGFDLEFPLSPSFSIADNDVWTPLTSAHPRAGNRGIFTYEVIARLKPGAALEQARADLTTIGRQLEQAYGGTNKGRSFNPVPAHEHMVGHVRRLLLVLLAAVGSVLLITCVNLANLLLSRATVRRKEMAIRAALGAGRARIVRQLLTESLLLASLGGLVGLGLAIWAAPFLANFPGVNLPRAEEVRVDYYALGFTFCLSLATGALFGLAPALAATRADLHGGLKEGGWQSAAPGQRRLSQLLIVSETALALMLLVGAGLLTGSFLALLKVNPGFKMERALAFTVSISPTRYTDQQQAARFFQRLTDKLKILPGVQTVGAVSSLPLSRHTAGSAARVEGRQSPPGEQPTRIGWQTVTPDYFKTMGMQLLRGRDFSSDDLARTAHMTIINESLAQRIFPGADPLGKRVTFGGGGTQPDWHEIIGVVSDTRHLSLDDQPQPRAYDLFGQHGGRAMFVVARVAGDPASLAGAVRAEVRQLDAEAPVYEMTTLEELVARSAATRRFSMSLIGALALIALALAAVGVYGVINYSVSQRTREIGIRMALGARGRDVIKLVIGQGLRLTLIGVACGLTAALALTRLMRSLLFGVSATDPVTFVGVAALLTFVALLACWIPARRAAKVAPLMALRHE